jgi:hypothetical protein
MVLTTQKWDKMVDELLKMTKLKDFYIKICAKISGMVYILTT